MAYFQAGDYRKAIEDCSRIIALKPNHPILLVTGGMPTTNLAITESLKLAFSDYTKAIYLAPKNSEYLLFSTNTALKLKRYEDAFQDLKSFKEYG